MKIFASLLNAHWKYFSYISVCMTLVCGSLHAGFKEHAGELDGALYRIAEPDTWNGGLVLYNHGYRTKEQPLSAVIEWHKEPFATLLDKGWLVAGSSYRRNGWIIKDAVTDVKALETFIKSKWDGVQKVLLIGESMGGAITLRLIEGSDADYVGALILGSGVESRDSGSSELTHLLKKPVLFLTNQSESDEPSRYVSSARDSSKPHPVLWTVLRDGHLNFNAQELNESINALLDWIETEKAPLTRSFVHQGSANKSLAVFSEDGVATAKVVSIDPNYGNLSTEFTEEDFSKLGITKGKTFILMAGDKEQIVSYVTTYSDVKRGQWLAFTTGEGYVQIAINYGSAVDALKVKVGAQLSVKAH